MNGSINRCIAFIYFLVAFFALVTSQRIKSKS